jgi:hypothetical protein
MRRSTVCICSSYNIVKVIESRNTRWAINVACMEKMRNAYKCLAANLKARSYLDTVIRMLSK